MKPLGRSALVFVALGLALYAVAYGAAERLMYRTGKSNPFYKIATVDRPEFDWVILGASHAMPLDFADVRAAMERATGLRVLNLASQGSGPLYNRFVLEHFLARFRARNLLYAVDSFAFYLPLWNEDRFADAKLLRRTPFETGLVRRMWGYVRDEGVDPRALLDYAVGFSKINNRERFEPDIWEGEKQFDRVYRPSTTAVQKRIAYLYPDPPDPALFRRYLDEFKELVALARRNGMRVVVIKMPVPPQFLRAIPDEAAFDAALAELLKDEQASFHDFARLLTEARFYFDSDHLNRAGLTELFDRHLKGILVAPD